MKNVKNPLKNLSFVIKNKMILEKIDRKWQVVSSSWKKNRSNEYHEQALNPKDALSIIFPDKSIDPEIFQNLENHLDAFISKIKKNEEKSIDFPHPLITALDKSTGRFLFSICYFSQPELIIETGVAYGFSSSYILLALNLLKKGKLISIDVLLRKEHKPEKFGIAIPTELKERQQLIIGKSTEELKKILQGDIKIDIFMHDSLHTYKYMMEEFQIAWPFIKKHGFLVSDDVSDNNAFLDFSENVRRKPIIIFDEIKKTYFGLIQK